jgi:hypothetical protein
MVSLGGIGSTVQGALFSWGFWLLMAVVTVGVVFGSLYMRKKGKYKFPAFVLCDVGNGKAGVEPLRAGWFKSKKLLGGLIEVGGERRLELNDGRIVQQASTTDCHQIKGKAGFLLFEKPDDPKIVVPLHKCHLSKESQEVLWKIAPADFRDAGLNIIEDAKKESMSNWTTTAQILVFGFVGVVLFISIILTIQYAKNTMAEAQAIHKEALQFYERTIDRLQVAPSGSTAP